MESPFPPSSINDYSDSTDFAPQAFTTAESPQQPLPRQQDSYLPFTPSWNFAHASFDPRNSARDFAEFAQQSNQQFPRAPSISSVTTNSPYSRASSTQYPPPFPSQPGGQHLSQSWDNYNSPGLAAQHLPTPTRTPTRDSFMERKETRRTPARPKAEGPAVAQGSRGALGGHWATNGHNGLTADVQYGPVGETEAFARYHNISKDLPFDEYAGNRGVPTLDRTMTDACADELYNPSAATQSTNVQRQTPQNNSQYSPSSALNERLQAAQLARSSSPIASRGPSPFRQSSPYAAYNQNLGQMQTAVGMRQQQKREADVLAYQQHHNSQQNDAQSTTVSPKDAFPDQPEPEEENMPPLFPQVSNQSLSDPPMYGPSGGAPQTAYGGSMPATSMAFGNPSIMAGVQYQDMKYGAPTYDNQQLSDTREQFESSQGANGNEFSEYTPSNVKTEYRDNAQRDNQQADAPRPGDTRANTGTYSCTYHGCALRFETPQKLQKHKREGHRGAGARHHRNSSVGSPVDSGDGSSMTPEAMTQAGPHKCTRINPTTGRPCNTVFSRPYDLTRHEYSLHSAEKKKLRCQYCTEEKLFSRQDALTRHTRVCHQEVAVPGKARRRPV
ncbi:MAG: hypothetical protein M1831_001893 [Alyxoria varia]|nr:MAG: hypothetical protein M1831_001893 [Alyxoria varia]